MVVVRGKEGIDHQDITEGLSRAHLTDPHKLNHFLFQC